MIQRSITHDNRKKGTGQKEGYDTIAELNSWQHVRAASEGVENLSKIYYKHVRSHFNDICVSTAHL